jgi:nucleotide-binding universal stress UspA family protein
MLHVQKPFDSYAGAGAELSVALGSDWHEIRSKELRRWLDAFLGGEFGSLPVKRVMLEGDPAVVIVKLAEAERIDLIVMPTHGYGPFRRFLLGSVTAKVLHDANCPVLTGVHIAEMPLAEPIFFRTIVCAVDLGKQSEKALAWAANLAAEFNAKLIVVHALPPLDVGEPYYFDQDLPKMLARRAREQLEELQSKLGIAAAVILDRGDVAKAVRTAAESQQADLVVIGRHADSGILDNTYAIIRKSPCPVVSV